MMPSEKYTLESIMKILPHRPPFLFVDRVVKLVPDQTIITERELRPEEPHFAGHFPGLPIMPGVLVTDALAQTAGLLWGLSKVEKGCQISTQPEIFFLAAANMKFTHPATPGDTLRMTACTDRSFGSLISYTVDASVGRNLIAKGTMTLALKENL